MKLSVLTTACCMAAWAVMVTWFSAVPVRAQATEAVSETPAQSVAPQESAQMPATTRTQAAGSARTGAGRSNPFSVIDGFAPFPTAKADSMAQEAAKYAEEKRKAEEAKKHMNVQIPGPPNIPGYPTQSGYMGPGVAAPPSDLLTQSELPAPPEKPSIASKMKLTAIIGDRAIFEFTDVTAASKNKWPKAISLGPGEQFESVSVSSVTPDAVTLIEDGDRSVKELPRVK